MNFKVRKANLNDLEKLAEFIIAEANEAEGISEITDKIQNGIKTGLENPSVARYWVLENEKEDLVGCVSVVKEWSDWNCAFYWWIQSMYILTGYRGKGLMERLFQKVKHAAKKEDALELRLYVHRDNKRAIKAYQKAGFGDSDYNIMILRLDDYQDLKYPFQKFAIIDKDFIRNAISNARKGINQYLEIMRLLPVTDVSSDKYFQKKFNHFYRIRQRNQQFYDIYYNLMQELKGKTVCFTEVMKYLHQTLGRFEPSFSSKLVATHNPNKPIWDSVVLNNIGIQAPPASAQDRMARIIKVYEDIINWYEEYLNTDEANLIIEIFDRVANKPSINNLKKIDFFLWQIRPNSEPEQPSYPPPAKARDSIAVNTSQAFYLGIDNSVISVIKDKFSKTGTPIDIPLLRGDRSFSAELSEEGIYVDNLRNQPFLPWIVFQETVNILNRNGGKAKRGDAMNFKLGETGLPFNSIEGHIASVVYGKKRGDSVFRRITPIACIFIWAGICKAAPGELILLYPIKM